jgi:hypothetical protein
MFYHYRQLNNSLLYLILLLLIADSISSDFADSLPGLHQDCGHRTLKRLERDGLLPLRFSKRLFLGGHPEYRAGSERRGNQ